MNEKMIRYKNINIGRIPKEWKMVKLKNIIEFRNGNRPIFSEKGEYKVYGANGAMGMSNKFMVDKNLALIIGRVGASGEIHLATGKFWVSDNAIYSVNYDPRKIEMTFLYYLLKFKNLKRLATRSTHPILTQTQINNLKIPIPPFPEQKKIAEILGTVDEAIQKVYEAIKKTERLKKGLMQELLTKGIGHKEFKDTKIGRMPKEWEVAKLGDVSINFISGGTPSTKEPAYWGGDIPWMTSAHINGKTITQGMRYITKEGIKNSASKIVPKNNILIATRVGIGKIAINLVDMAISQDLTGMVLNRNEVNEDFIYWLLSHYETKLKALAQGSTIKGLIRSEIKKLIIACPSLPEQRKIAEILSSVDKKLETLRLQKGKYERVKKGLMQDLLTGKRRVKV